MASIVVYFEQAKKTEKEVLDGGEGEET